MNEIKKENKENKEAYEAPEALINRIETNDVLLDSLEVIPWGKSNTANW